MYCFLLFMKHTSQHERLRSVQSVSNPEWNAEFQVRERWGETIREDGEAECSTETNLAFRRSGLMHSGPNAGNKRSSRSQHQRRWSEVTERMRRIRSHTYFRAGLNRILRTKMRTLDSVTRTYSVPLQDNMLIAQRWAERESQWRSSAMHEEMLNRGQESRKSLCRLDQEIWLQCFQETFKVLW